MKLILIATPRKLEDFLDDAIGYAQKLSEGISNFTASLRQQNQNSEAKAPIKTIKQELSLQDKLSMISEHLELPVPINYVPLDQAHQLEFDIGDLPTNGSFYISHPFLENVFIRPSKYTQVLAREKEAAFIHLASTLGAKSIHLNGVTITQSSQIFGTKIKPSFVAQQIGIKASFDTKGEMIKEIYKQFHKPKRAPYVPKELEKWVKLDPALRQLATSRMELNLATIKVNLHFKETNTGGSQIATALAGRKLEIGGQIQKIHESTWHFFVEFFDKDELEAKTV